MDAGAAFLGTSDAPQAARGADEERLVDALCAGDEAAFVTLVERYHTLLVRLARNYVASEAVAEEVAQETWLAVLEGIRRFQRRAALKTWLCQILINRAKTRGVREARSLPFSALGDLEGDAEPAVEPERFLPADHRWAGHWAAPPQSWAALPESALLAQETRAQVAAAVAALPPAQETIIRLRDVEGWTPEEVCALLDITDANQRVLLHRARSKVRAALERYLSPS